MPNKLHLAQSYPREPTLEVRSWVSNARPAKLKNKPKSLESMWTTLGIKSPSHSEKWKKNVQVLPPNRTLSSRDLIGFNSAAQNVKFRDFSGAPGVKTHVSKAGARNNPWSGDKISARHRAICSKARLLQGESPHTVTKTQHSQRKESKLQIAVKRNRNSVVPCSIL